ncbi:hypothetical protein M0802_015642, partial [Mischocyttarus mexicanus]
MIGWLATNKQIKDAEPFQFDVTKSAPSRLLVDVFVYLRVYTVRQKVFTSHHLTLHPITLSTSLTIHYHPTTTNTTISTITSIPLRRG